MIGQEQLEIIEQIELFVNRKFTGNTKAQATEFIVTYYGIYAMIKCCIDAVKH